MSRSTFARWLTLLALFGSAACGSNSTSGNSSTSATTASTSAGSATSPAASSSPDISSSAGPVSSSPVESSTSADAQVSTPASATVTSSGGTVCTKDQVTTKTAGKLTVATDDPAYEPWFSDNDPTNGKGYESAVAYAVGTKLGFDKADVAWVRVKFNAAIAPGPKDFDFDINEFSISEARRQAVDFSTGYYDVTQAVVTTKRSPLAKATTIAALQDAKLGAQLGTTSLTALKDQIKPSSNPTVFQTNEAAVQALKNNTVDAVVFDLPTAFEVTAAELDDGVLLGQLPASSGTPEQFGLLLDKGSALTACASKAVDALRADGTLAKLEEQWLTKQGAPELK